MEKEPRFDIMHGQYGCAIDFHFCREWDEDGNGCYGGNPYHGVTFDEAKAQMAEYHRRKAKEWESLTLDEWIASGSP